MDRRLIAPAHGGLMMTDARAADRHRLPASAGGDDRLIAYALAADPVFTGMRALIGQLSGILILAQARCRRDVAELPELAAARERWREVVDHLSRVDAPEGRQLDLRRLQEASAHVGEAIGVIAEMRQEQTDEGVARASAHLKAAYRLAQSACDHRLGLAMVDTSGACCSCGAKLE
jgi:hypothetical protein